MEMEKEIVFSDDDIAALRNFFSFWSNPMDDDMDSIRKFSIDNSKSSHDDLIRLLKKLLEQDTEDFLLNNTQLTFPRNGRDSKQWTLWILKQIKIQRDRLEVIEHTESGVINSLRDKVAWILNNHKETRNSDRLLALYFWETFEPELYNQGVITPDNFMQLTTPNSITRERARIQNQYKLFQADDVVKKQRGTLQEEERQRAVEDKPSVPVFVVYMDESGKTQENLVVGSVWILLNLREVHLTLYHIQMDQLRGKEFHFKNIRDNTSESYTAMVDAFIEHANTVNFKALYTPRTGLKRKEIDVILDLYYHLLIRGIEYEFSTGRALPPRKLLVWIDSTESQMDKILCKNLEDRLRQAAHTHFNGQLLDVQVNTIDSKSTIFLQIADLLASSVNRILTSQKEMANVKDKFANNFLSRVGIDVENMSRDQISDTSILISLT